MRSVCRTVEVQYSHESSRASANPIRVVTTNAPSAVSAARISRRRRKYSRNTAGVSFSAIATPSSSPRGQGVRRGTQSAITRVISTTLIWPKEKFAWIGSNHSTESATRPAASHPRRSQSGPTGDSPGTCRRVSTIQTDTTSNTQVITVTARLATGSDTSARGLNTMAASGG